MPSRSFNTNTSSLFADGPSNLGGGQDDHLPIGGPWSGYTFRAAILFATNYADMVRITKATLRLTTTTQVHIGFSSAPDIYVRRATASWTANGGRSSADSGGGGGWSTSPTVYPGPSSTSTGGASKRMPTSQGTAVDIDVTAIVRAWAPTSVEGGGGATNYGIVLLPVASGDISEVYSAEASSGLPVITVEYETDAPPVATPTGPTGTVTTNRPTITATGSDPDGDAITSYGIEVRQGSTVVYSATTGSGPTLSHVPTANLPSGPLTVRVRATAGGLTGAYSADLAFTVNRLPVMGAWSAPAANVTGTRRPVHTVAWSDPDGDAGEVYDIEVYASVGGSPTGSAVYARTNQSTGLSAASVSHTPAADLPGGELAARVRVKANGQWSAWSSYRVYTVVLTTPSLTWEWPTYDGAFAKYRASDLADATRPIANVAVEAVKVNFAPPSGTTIATVVLRVEVIESGLNGPAPGFLIYNTGVGPPVPAQGWLSFAFRPDAYAANWLAGTVKITVTITAANSGQTVESRHMRFSLGEWTAATALGDGVQGLSAVETRKLDEVAMLYRAQTSTGAAAGGSTFGPLAAAAALLPATNAYLGIRARMGRAGDDDNRLIDGSFEEPANLGPTGSGKPWFYSSNATVDFLAGGTIDGARVARIRGSAALPNYPSVAQDAEVVPGATYRVSAWIRMAPGSAAGRQIIMRVDTIGPNNATVTAGVISITETGTTYVYKEGFYTVPADGSVAKLRVLFFLNATAVPLTDEGRADAAAIYGIGPGDAGFDRLALAWTSLG